MLDVRPLEFVSTDPGEDICRTADAMHASVIAATALGFQTRQQRGSLDHLYGLLAKRFVHLPEVELRDAAAVVRCIVNRYSWYVLAINHALPATESARERRNRRAMPSPPATATGVYSGVR